MLGVFLFCVLFTFLSLLTRLPRQSILPWWVKVITQAPHCTYYFGPFESAAEARQTQFGYVEDLEQEGARGIAVLILQGQPKTLTICEEEYYQ